MKLIGSYKNSGFEVVADGVMDFLKNAQTYKDQV
jgi:hypothetical protein